MYLARKYFGSPLLMNKWKEHNEVQCKKVLQSIALLRRAKAVCKTIYTTQYVLMLHHICSYVWSDGSFIHIGHKYTQIAKVSCSCDNGLNFEKLGLERIENILKNVNIL